MKKFLLSMAVASMAMTASAQVYVVGAGDGLGWDLPGMEVAAKSSNVYEFTVDNLSKFKVSTVKATSWEEFNPNAYATGTAEYTAEGVVKAGGETLPVEIWGEDQMLPFTGKYTITLDLNNMTMTAYCSSGIPTEAPTVYVRGAMNDWGTPSTWQFNYDVPNDVYWFICQGETELAGGVEFKFADANWGSINYSTNGEIIVDGVTTCPLVFNQGNQFFSTNFTGLITLNIVGPTSSSATFAPGVFEYTGTDGVNEIAAEEGQAVYFNLQGQKVANPDKGIYVKVVDGKATKIVK